MAAIKMLHERIMVLVKYVTEVIAGKFFYREPGFCRSKETDRRPGYQRSCRVEVAIRADGFLAGDREPRVP